MSLGDDRDIDDALPALGSAAVPRATYRLQLAGALRFDGAAALVPYLAALGVSHLYASPILAARRGSTHGYDVVDFGRLNPEIGGDDDFARLGDALAAHDMRLVLDIVPNHMAVLEADNAWWFDVLQHGPAAPYARAFDIEWSPAQRELHGKLLLPVLGRPYGEALEAGEITAAFDADAGRFELRYFGHRFPVDPRDHAEILMLAPLPEAATAVERAHVAALRVRFARLPPRDAADPGQRALRAGETAALQRSLATLAREPWAAGWLAACAAALHGASGDAASFDRLDALLQRQAYRLAHWRTASDEINYRRFFDVNALAGLRMEEPSVFDEAHRLVLGWVGSGRVAGLRVDHPDGLADPEAYFEQLARHCHAALLASGGAPRATFVVVEKILADEEPWPRHWHVHGDTGYRFANQAVGLLVDGTNEAEFDALHADFLGAAPDFDAELDAAKRSIIARSLAADLRLLTGLAHDVALGGRHTRDLTRNGLHEAIVELAAAYDVYRSYATSRGTSAADRARIEKCAAAARARCRPSLVAYVDFVRQLLLAPDDGAAAVRECRQRFVQRFQQFTAPVMAKAMEDTAFYRYHRLVALNDVGGDPRRFGHAPPALHAANLARCRDTPHTLLATSTHDSKRSADVRARLAVLSEMPARWRETLQRLRELARTQWHIASLETTPADNDLLLLFQTLVGVWPCEAAPLGEEALAALRKRVGDYMLKAVREAKQRSSWLDGDDAYERAVVRCVEVLLARVEPNPFVSELRRFVAAVAPYGCANSLALVALKLTSPGVPDIYQGDEDWCCTLVDPDNRAPVDFARLRARLDAAMQLGAGDDTAAALRREPAAGGLQKIHATWRLLQWRAQAAALFRDGSYEPLAVHGSAADHVFAFARRHGDECSITVVARLLWRATGGDVERLRAGRCYGNTVVELPADTAAAHWSEVVTGQAVHALRRSGGTTVMRAAEVLHVLPIAVLRPD